MQLNSRSLLGLCALLCFAALGIALTSQYLFDMPPCAWCVMQRLIYLLIGVLCLAGWLAGPLLRRLTALLGAALALAGSVAAWHQYSVAAKLFSCEQTFADRLMTGIGLDASVPWLFGIYASCMDAAVHLLGIEYAIWSLMLFALLAGLQGWAALRRH